MASLVGLLHRQQRCALRDEQRVVPQQHCAGTVLVVMHHQHLVETGKQRPGVAHWLAAVDLPAQREHRAGCRLARGHGTAVGEHAGVRPAHLANLGQSEAWRRVVIEHRDVQRIDHPALGQAR